MSTTAPTHLHRAAIAALVALAGLAASVAAYTVHRAPRPPVPDVVAEVEAVERRTVYLLHDLGREAGPLVCGCEAASVGTSPRRAGR